MTEKTVRISQRDFTARVKNHVLAKKNFNKIFCIGYNKTGTTTMARVLRLYGYRVAPQAEQECTLTENFLSTNYALTAPFLDRYDAFQDMPFSQGLAFVAMDALFPDSRFILTVRDSASWYQSLTSYHRQLGISPEEIVSEQDALNIKYLYEGYTAKALRRTVTNFTGSKPSVEWDLSYDRAHLISLYEERNNQVQKYFMERKDKLLVVDVTEEQTTRRICDFLNIPQRYTISMPWENRTRPESEKD